MQWYRERGLTKIVREVLEEDQKFSKRKKGDVWEYEVITTHYGAGRIDIRDSSKEGYDGWHEYSLAPMHGEDWNALDDWLAILETDDVWEYEHLIEFFEKYYGKKIRWDNVV